MQPSFPSTCATSVGPRFSPHKPHRPLAVVASALLSLLCACANTTQTAPAVSLFDTQWQLTAIGSQAVLESPMATLVFQETRRVSGKGSCNNFFGTVEVSGERITVGTVGSTKRACLGGVGEQESRYLGALQKAERFEVKDGTLLIYTSGEASPLKFVALKP